MSKNKRWTKEEDTRLLRQVRAFPQNLNKCFIIVGEELGRSTGAVAARWYQYLSKDPKNPIIVTASPFQKMFNRKNGKGMPSTPTLFKRLLKILNF